jgi:hypothetical protein
MKTLLLGFILSLTLTGHAETGRVAADKVLNPAVQLKPKREQLILEQAHQVFSESWRLMIGAQEGSGLSLFKATANILKNTNLNTNLQMSEQPQCSKPATYRTIGSAASVFRGKKDSCSEAATLVWKNKDTLMFTAWPAQFPEAVGGSVSLLNQQLQCRMQVSLGLSDSSAKLIAMECKNLMQSIGRSQHLAYRVFAYNSRGSQILSVAADRFENLVDRMLCDGPKACLQLRVPAQGNVSFLEDHRLKMASVSKNQRQENLPFNNPQPRPVPVAPVPLPQVNAQANPLPSSGANETVPEMQNFGFVGRGLAPQAAQQAANPGTAVLPTPVTEFHTNEQINAQAISPEEQAQQRQAEQEAHDQALIQQANQNQLQSAEENVAGDVGDTGPSAPTIR